ncbi:hypothetical protein [Devosia sp. 63-57]|uniref:hypothetical protein n=1 Tax=Devosia sp. 63-57 TaxID=1895751 RepID=UPI00086BF0E6|nr:hypothetical protein [Devosia sp. 63-57]ODT50282.1 MAG: hypothetical protein ABS74_05025 [Pelagibacterium sp. SCN 63-126]ODU82746.1 MAG: hypothetical protein ABT14_16515 [Pelagibacterium sp. SCN 63-17]OJX45026.1 MAG: hypothetical protein BGO80_04025 [Devosia sp. 63-57]
MTGPWKHAGEKPQIAEGTKLAVLMRGTSLGESAVVEVEGFYLNAYRLHMRDGCECFEDDNIPDALDHAENGCPWFGFHIVQDDPDGEFAELYVEFDATEWCKR